MLSTHMIHGIAVAGPGVEAAVELLLAAVAKGEPTTYRFVNAYSLALADVDPEYHALLAGPGVNFSDGKPLSEYLRKVCDADFRQVRGPSLFEEVLTVDGPPLRHYFLGGSPDLLAALVDVLQERRPGIVIAGCAAPPFRKLTPAEQDAQDATIAATSPDIVWVGLGTPKQDHESRRLTERLGVTCIGVGAAFDFLSGAKPTAPPVLRRWGLEWGFRLYSEPRRLLWRYLWGNLRFTRVVLRDLVGRRRARRRRP